MTIKEVKELIEKYKDKPIIVRTGYACFDYTESGEELIKVVTSMTEYKEPQFVPNPNGTITFYMPTEEGDGTDYGVTVYGWENGVIGYRYGTSCDCLGVREFETDNLIDFINGNYKYEFN